MFYSSWKTFKTRFGPIIGSLRRYRELISVEKLTITISEVRDLREFVEENFETLAKRLEELYLEDEGTLRLQEQRGRKLQFVLNKFDVADCQKDLEHARRERRHHNASGDWIFDHPLFKEWADLTIRRNSTLYLNGIPGAGPLRFHLCRTR